MRNFFDTITVHKIFLTKDLQNRYLLFYLDCSVVIEHYCIGITLLHIYIGQRVHFLFTIANKSIGTLD